MYDCNIVSVQKILFLKNRPCSTELDVLKTKSKLWIENSVHTQTFLLQQMFSLAFPQLCQSGYTHENKTFPARIKDQNPRYSKEAT